MMNNDNEFKKVMNNIHASEELKKKTLEKMNNTSKFKKSNVTEMNNSKVTETKKSNVVYFNLLGICAMLVVVVAGAIYMDKNPFGNGDNGILNPNNGLATKMEKDKEVYKFKDFKDFKNTLAKASSNSIYRGDTDKFFDMSMSTTAESSSDSYAGNFGMTESINSAVSGSNNSKGESDFSKTNTQVEGVDEADISKTDGTNIYYITNSTVYIIDAKNLEILAQKEITNFVPRELFVQENKLIVIGNGKEDRDNKKENCVTAIVYDIKDAKNPKEIRTVSSSGSYLSSRMIGDNVYMISNRRLYSYYDDCKEIDVLPILKDSVLKDEKMISAEDIYCIPDSSDRAYTTVTGFNLNNKEEASVETIYGASENVYASTNNIYITCDRYVSSKMFYGKRKSTIYKFELNNGNVKYKTNCKINGEIKNQFSLDEYEGNLRVATTSTNSFTGNDINKLYVLDENLNQIGIIEGYARNESIYSVRFMGKVGYVVTFEQIDPLFVIDLSDPTNPQIKGELEIPGYSSYLHPYDETHVIGIGYNTEDNGYGGVRNSNMKMSMFDVSDLENPKEMFKIDIGSSYVSSEVLNNHKALFYNKAENLIGFPIRESGKSKIEIFKIDLKKGFKKYGEIEQKYDYYNVLERALYIDDVLYTLSTSEVTSYDLNTLKMLKELKLFEKKATRHYYDEIYDLNVIE